MIPWLQLERSSLGAITDVLPDGEPVCEIRCSRLAALLAIAEAAQRTVDPPIKADEVSVIQDAVEKAERVP